MAVSGVLVHSVEGHATGLHGSRPGAHDVPWDVKSASLEKFVLPWTVQRQVWKDSLKPCHSGLSTDVLLFIIIMSTSFPEGLPVLYTCICVTGGGPVSEEYGVSGSV